MTMSAEHKWQARKSHYSGMKHEEPEREYSPWPAFFIILLIVSLALLVTCAVIYYVMP